MTTISSPSTLTASLLPTGSTTSPAQTSTSTSAISSTPSSGDKPIAAAVAVGISVGVIACIILVVCGCSALGRRARRRAAEAEEEMKYEKAEIAGTGSYPRRATRVYLMTEKIDVRSQPVRYQRDQSDRDMEKHDEKLSCVEIG